MKKFYSIFVVILMAAVGMVAHAQTKTITITTNNTAACWVYNMIDYSYPQWVDDQVTITFTNEWQSVNVYTNTGYEITGVEIDGVAISGVNSGYFELKASEVNDGSKVVVSADKQKDKLLYIVGDASKITVKDFTGNDLSADDQVNGKWAVTVPAGAYSSAEINAVEGYMITSAVGSDGITYAGSATDYFYVSASQLTAPETTVTVETKSLDELYPAKIKVNVVGNGYQVGFRFNGQYNGKDLNTGENIVHYNPETDVPFTVAHAYNSSYNPMSLYSVKHNGVELTANEDREFTVTPVSDTEDVIDIQVEAPAVDVPVTFTFEGDGRDAIKNIYMGERVDPDTYDSFIGVLGKTLNIEFNSEGYDITKFTLNGEDQEMNYGYFTTQVGPESGMNFVVAATAKPGLKTTIICENYQNLILASDYDFTKTYTLTGVETEIEIPLGDQYLYAKALNGYRLNAVYDIDGNTFSTGSPVYVYEGGKTICYEVGEFRRDETAVVYIEDTQWSYLQMTVAPRTSDITVDYSFDKGNLSTGYNFIPFNSKTDLPFSIYTYDSKGASADLYINGEKLVKENYVYPALNELKDGDVLKIMTTDAAQHAVSYTLSGVDADKVVVRHDHVMTVDHSANHNVFAGTAVHIVAAEGANIAVKANDETIEADENGVFAHTVAGNVNFVITDASGVANIAVDAVDADNTIYNLQGVPVGTDINALPAGLYISAGQKVIKK